MKSEWRHFCRNPHCRAKLPEPVDNERAAFCCKGCFHSYFLKRCLVCERPTESRRRARFCKRRACRDAYRRNPLLYEPAGGRTNAETSIRLGLDRVSPAPDHAVPHRHWGPPLTESQRACALLPLDRDITSRLRRTNDLRQIEREVEWGRGKPIFTPDTPPLNLIGGYRFPGAPAITLRPKRLPVALPLDGDNLAIPDFLRRAA